MGFSYLLFLCTVYSSNRSPVAISVSCRHSWSKGAAVYRALSFISADANIVSLVAFVIIIVLHLMILELNIPHSVWWSTRAPVSQTKTLKRFEVRTIVMSSSQCWCRLEVNAHAENVKLGSAVPTQISILLLHILCLAYKTLSFTYCAYALFRNQQMATVLHNRAYQIHIKLSNWCWSNTEKHPVTASPVSHLVYFQKHILGNCSALRKTNAVLNNTKTRWAQITTCTEGLGLQSLFRMMQLLHHILTWKIVVCLMLNLIYLTF